MSWPAWTDSVWPARLSSTALVPCGPVPGHGSAMIFRGPARLNCQPGIRQHASTKSSKELPMSLPKVVPADEWLAARKELLTAEAQAVSALAEVSARRRELPAVKIDKEYVFDGPNGKAT